MFFSNGTSTYYINEACVTHSDSGIVFGPGGDSEKKHLNAASPVLPHATGGEPLKGFFPCCLERGEKTFCSSLESAGGTFPHVV